MELQFVKLSPTQNMTVLVESPLPRSQYQSVAQRLMAYEHIHAEQVGFLEPPASPLAWRRMEMMGGEFCGNALMSAAALLVWQSGAPAGCETEVPLECSGAEGIIPCRATMEGGAVRVSVPIPAPREVAHQTLTLDGADHPVTVVQFNGITHLVVPRQGVTGNPHQFSKAALAAWGPLFQCDACGLMLFDRQQETLLPLVYVKLTDSLVWERGCGSGSAAVGVHLAALADGSVSIDLKQPGGVIAVTAEMTHGEIAQLSITGHVKIVARGSAYL